MTRSGERVVRSEIVGRSGWVQIDINPDGEHIRVGLQSSEALRTGARKLDTATLEQLRSLEKQIRTAALRRDPVPDDARDALTRLTTQIFTSDVPTDSVLTKTVQSAEGHVLLRIAATEPVLSAFPWEAMRTEDGYLSGSSRFSVVRLPRLGEAANQFDIEVDGQLRVLLLAPAQLTGAAADALRTALAPAGQRGEVELLPPVIDIESAADPVKCFHDRLKETGAHRPHVLHFIGHGDAAPGQVPRLQIGGDTWFDVEQLARHVQQDFREVRLVVLEACRGAAPGVFASAAERLCRAGVEAVLAFLWAVEEDFAQAFVTAFYEALTAEGPARGDVVASLEAARGALLPHGAAVFTAVLYLRGEDGRVFDFRKPRGHEKTGGGVSPSGLDIPLARLLAGPFSLVLGGVGSQKEILQVLREELTGRLREEGEADLEDAPWSALADRFVSMFGAENLHQLCQQALREAAQAALERPGERDQPGTALVRALGRRLPAGVHVTLLWEPLLERIAGKSAASQAVYAVQPSIQSVKDPPSVFRRAPGQSRWTVARAPDRVGPDDIAVLRLLGGLMATDTFSSPVLTDDDHLVGVFVSPAFRPAWMNPYLASLRGRRALFVGMRALDWHHRLLLRWLFDRSLPDESVVLLPPSATRAERVAWEERGAGLGGTERAHVVQRSEGELAALLGAETGR